MSLLLVATLAQPLPPAERLPALESVLAAEADTARTVRMRFGLGAMLTAAVIVPMGLSELRRAADRRSGSYTFGGTLALGGAVLGGLGFITAVIPSDVESMHRDIVRSRRLHESPTMIVRRVESRWSELAARERNVRPLGWILFGAGVLLLGTAAYGAVVSSADRPSSSWTFFGLLGAVYVLGGMTIASMPGYYERGLEIYRRAVGLSVGPVAGGAAGVLTVVF